MRSHLGLLPPEIVTVVTELGTRLLASELPIDFDAVPVGPAVPGSRFPLQDGQTRDSASSQALSREQADLDLSLVKPASVRRSVVYRKAVPKVAAFLLTEVVGERLAAMNVQVVHD